jgi:hypothetical protein
MAEFIGRFMSQTLRIARIITKCMLGSRGRLNLRAGTEALADTVTAATIRGDRGLAACRIQTTSLVKPVRRTVV